MALSLVTAPAVPPITVADAKLQCRIPHDDEDALIVGLVEAARSRAEAVTGRQLIQATWDLKLDTFPCGYELRLPKAPLIAVTSFSYVDTNGVTQVWGTSNYQVDAPVGPTADRGRIQAAFGTSWPPVRTDTLNAIAIRFVAGYGADANDVPAAIRQAMLLMITTWYELRDDLALVASAPAPLGALALLTPYKLFD